MLLVGLGDLGSGGHGGALQIALASPWIQRQASQVGWERPSSTLRFSLWYPPQPHGSIRGHEARRTPHPRPQPHVKSTFSAVYLLCARSRWRCRRAPETGPRWTRIAPERGMAARKTTPRICSHPLSSEESWHGPGHGERREFLLQKNDLTFPL